MLRNYLKIVIRNILKFKTVSIINIAGLSFSFAVIILIAAYVQNELRIDRFHTNYKRIYKISKGTTPVKIADIIKSNIPEIEKIAPVDIISSPSVTIKYKNHVLSLQDIIYTRPEFFKIFSFKSFQGNLDEALSKPMSLILTQSEANRIFGNEIQ